MVCRIDGEIVDLGGKIKTDRCTVMYAGDRKTATDKIRNLCGDGPIIGGFVTGGYGATVTGGDYATVTGGNVSTVTGGYRSTVSGGCRATVTGGYRSTVSGGNGATLSIKWWDGSRYRIAVAYVGEDGIKAGTPYRIEAGKFVELEP
jgi:hypothetical protein